MKVIIDIEDGLYNALLNGYEEPYSRQFSDCIKNGTPLNKCKAEDCISRQTVLKLQAKTPVLDDTIQCTEFHYEQMVSADLIENLPPVSPKSDKPSGKWISHGEHCKQLGVLPSGLGSYWWCSNCGTGIESTQFHRVEYNYCPNCGAKMDG